MLTDLELAGRGEVGPTDRSYRVVPDRICRGRLSQPGRVEQQAGHGCTVYVHCWGGNGRTGAVVGCRLRRHGYAGVGDAIELLRRLRVQGDRKGGHKPTT